MVKLHRAQILLEAEQHKALADVAQQEGRSISDIVRDVLREWFSRRDHETQRKRELNALEDLTQIRSRIQEQHGVYQGDLLAEARDGRDEDFGRVWRGDA
ncbi:MAG: hypothetical protein MUO76_09345 [Anaerolineaceae bacterium]|nr:hypothetical protein [Anaerolineaceae bacterium]